LLLLLVGVTAYVAGQAGLQAASDWRAAAQPLLVGTVALGGGLNTLPLLYGRLRAFSRADMRRLVTASVSGLLAVYLLNVVWTLCVLRIVPQRGPAPSLQAAGLLGQAATEPLVRVIEARFPALQWLALLVGLFVALSISVSFLTVGAGCKHTVDGIGWALLQGAAGEGGSWRLRLRQLSAGRLQLALNVACFGTVALVAALNPRSFYVVLERGTSTALNLQAGAFVGLLLHASRRLTAGAAIPYALPRAATVLVWPMTAYFLFACCYNAIDVRRRPPRSGRSPAAPIDAHSRDPPAPLVSVPPWQTRLSCL
jgi:hypothetical protein